MIQEMEKAVSRRETILTRGEALMKMPRKDTQTKGDFQRQLGDLRKKIRDIMKESTECDHEMENLRDQQQQISQDLDSRQAGVRGLESSIHTVDGDIEKLHETKQKVFY